MRRVEFRVPASVLIPVLAGLAAGEVLLAQSATSKADEANTSFEDERFSDMISVTEVEVPVRVLIKGKPLLGLHVENFELYDKGALRPLVGFRQLDLIENLIVDAPPGEMSEESKGVQGRNLMVLIDFAFSGRLKLNMAMRGIRQMVETQLDPTDRLAIATYGPISGLNLLVGFTRDREAAGLALDAIDAMIDAKRKPQRE